MTVPTPADRQRAEAIDRVAAAIVDACRSENKNRGSKTLKETALLFTPMATAALNALDDDFLANRTAGHIEGLREAARMMPKQEFQSETNRLILARITELEGKT